MLISVAIKNFVIIETLDLSFGHGLTIITGETGAGKSIIFDAILFALGLSTDNKSVRPGCDSATIILEIQNRHLNSILLDAGIESEDVTIIKAQLFSSGRKKFFVNDVQVTQKLLSKISEAVLDVHVQGFHTSLLNSKSHIEILDKWCECSEQLTKVEKIYDAFKNKQKEAERIQEEAVQRNTDLEYHKMVVQDLEQLNPQASEEAILVEMRNDLQNHHKKQQAVSESFNIIAQSNILKHIAQVEKNLHKFMQDFSNIVNMLDQVSVLINEIQHLLQTEISDQHNCQHKKEEIENRLFNLRHAARKYKVSVDELPEVLRHSRIQVEQNTAASISVKDVEHECIQLANQYIKAALELSEIRTSAASYLEQKINSELMDLGFKNSPIKVSISHNQIKNVSTIEEARNAVTSKLGLDKVCFLISANAGMNYANLDEVASGGELSRVMLAIKTVLLKDVSKSVLILDEIDTGISGVIANSMGDKLKNISSKMQILTITHHPQIASKGDHHLLVYKVQLFDKTCSYVKSLSVEERVDEIARMISGATISDQALQAARAMFLCA